MPFLKPTKTSTRRLALLLDAREVPLIVRTNPRSRRMIVRYCPKQEAVLLTLPRRVSLKEGMAFVESRRNWLMRRIAEYKPRTPFTEGAQLPVYGQLLTLRHMPGGRSVTWQEGGILYTGGDAALMPQRVQRWLKQKALNEIRTHALSYATSLKKKITRITLRDTTSRWGSCASNGALSFSWRLIFAPPEVLHYVVCHEVAHLLEMNHGPRFWKLVALLCPHYKASRDWLSVHGEDLHRFG